MPHQSKVVGKSNLRVLSLSGTSYLGQGLSWPPFCWARTLGLPRALGGPTGIRGRNACDGRPPALLPLATWPAPSPPNPGGKKKRLPTAPAARRPRIGHPGALATRLTSAPSSPSHARSAAPWLPRAEGPPSSWAYGVLLPPKLLRPRAGPRRAGEVEQGEARGGRAGGDAQGGAGRSGQSAWGPTRPRSPRLRAILRRPPWEQPYVNPARVYTPLPPRRSPRRRDLALISALLPAHPLSPYSVPHKPRRKCAFFLPLGWIMSLKGNDQKCPSTNRILKLPRTGGPSQPWAAGVSLWTLTFSVASAPELEFCADWKAKPSQETSMPAESCLPPDSAVALEHPGFAELCKGTLLSVIPPPP